VRLAEAPSYGLLAWCLTRHPKARKLRDLLPKRDGGAHCDDEIGFFISASIQAFIARQFPLFIAKHRECPQRFDPVRKLAKQRSRPLAKPLEVTHGYTRVEQHDWHSLRGDWIARLKRS
jgi:hypothetical protein